MKRFLAISIFLTVLTTGCMNYDQAGTVDPADVTSNTAGTPPGDISSFSVVSISNVSVTNPLVRIQFEYPASAASITYGTSVRLEYDGSPLSYGTDYTADPDPVTEAVSAINLNISYSMLSTHIITVILTNAITTDSDTTVHLTAVSTNLTVGN